MKYIRLPFLTNTYPQTGNYIPTGENKSALFGRYSQINKIDFVYPDVLRIKAIDGTFFRNVIAVYKDKNDNSPKYYTSEIFQRDLQASVIESNPYFVSLTLAPSSILKIYLDDIIKNIKGLKEEELKWKVKFIRNNFILFKESGLVSTNNNNTISENNQQERSIIANPNAISLIQITKKIETFEEALISIEQYIEFGDNQRRRFGPPNDRRDIPTISPYATISDETFVADNNFLFNRRRAVDNIKEKVLIRINELKNEKDKLEKSDNTKKQNFSDSDNIKIKNVPDDIKCVIDKVVGAGKFEDIIDFGEFFIDCVLLMKYIDWVLTTPKVDDIGTEGVIPITELAVFKTSDGKVKSSDNLDPIGDPLPIDIQPSNKKYFKYKIVRLSIPAPIESSLLTFRDKFGATQQIQTDKYSELGEYCVEENSWGGNINVYQRLQLGPCDELDNQTGNGSGPTGGGGPAGGGGRSGGGNYDYYLNELSGGPGYIDYVRDTRPNNNIE